MAVPEQRRPWDPRTTPSSRWAAVGGTEGSGVCGELMEGLFTWASTVMSSSLRKPPIESLGFFSSEALRRGILMLTSF